MQGFVTGLGWLATALMDIGYIGVVVALCIEGMGLPFPGDAFLVFYGFACTDLSARSVHMHFLPMVGFATVGYIIGATISYTMARRFGTRWYTSLAKNSWFPLAKMEKTLALINRYGAWLLIPGRFLPGIRSFSSYAAGLGRMPFRKFFTYTLISAILWCLVWTGLGYWFAENIHDIFQKLQTYLFYITLAVAGGAVVYYGIRRSRRQV